MNTCVAVESSLPLPVFMDTGLRRHDEEELEPA
jgi:hypothetical protein